MSQITVANAPVSYGAFELTVGIDAATPDGLHVLDGRPVPATAGSTWGRSATWGRGGTGRPAGRACPRARGRLPGAAVLRRRRPGEGCSPSSTRCSTRSTPSPEGCPARPRTPRSRTPAPRNGAPTRAGPTPTTLSGWTPTGGGASPPASARLLRCRDRGYEPTFHNETGTYVEAPWEVERVLEVSDALLCLDTGHFLVGGGDPVAAVRSWTSRINQVHVKDASRAVVTAIVDEGDPVESVWSREAFPRLGEGDVDVDGVLQGLRELGWPAGWSSSRTRAADAGAVRPGRRRTSGPTASSCARGGSDTVPDGRWGLGRAHPCSDPLRASAQDGWHSGGVQRCRVWTPCRRVSGRRSSPSATSTGSTAATGPCWRQVVGGRPAAPASRPSP